MQTDNERTHTQDLAAAWGQSQAFPCPHDPDVHGMDFRSYLIGQIIQGSASNVWAKKYNLAPEIRAISQTAILIADEVLLQLAQERADKSQEAK